MGLMGVAGDKALKPGANLGSVRGKKAETSWPELGSGFLARTTSTGYF